ncbi:nudC domain-containing protein 1-like isoform X2 [Drosophila eugracilis]|uniref:nudC domain-containing protein 1-like isoform X2 n=1 Tax=Drosophila eugracilis TaxID=29029 RepID=UPI0007E88ABA|nr:nudC domain-containing protein 1-like isoform X2 [Drosophila eugracilis]
MSVVELNVNSTLIDTNFDGYKLSFEPVPVLRQNLEFSPMRQELITDDFSLLHAQLFDYQNHLFADPWLSYDSYFIDVRHQLIQCKYNPLTRLADGQRVVYAMKYGDQGDGDKNDLMHYNYTLKFVSERLCVICDGLTSYHLIDTGDRSRSGPQDWQLITRTPVNSAGEYHGYVLYDARMDWKTDTECKQISLVAGHVAHRYVVRKRHQIQVHFIDLTLGRWTKTMESNEWFYRVFQRLETTGSIQYCTFELGAESLIVASKREVQTPEQRKASDDDIAEAAANASPDILDCLLENELPPYVPQSSFEVRCTTCSVVVEYMTHVIFTACLYGDLDPDFPEWKMKSNGLEVELTKEEHEYWPQLLAELKDGVEEEIKLIKKGELPFPNLLEPSEEDDMNYDDTRMVRFNFISGCITHTIFLDISPLQFSKTLLPGFPAAFATREGVDTSIWMQNLQPTPTNEWSVSHEGQLHAFGIMYASKNNRKFASCCPDLEYAVICERSRHVTIYQPLHDADNGLRNRDGSPVSKGKQSIVTLPARTGEILGMNTSKNLITILSKNALLHLQIF